MKWIDLKNKNTNELKEMLAEMRGELHNLRFQAKAQQLKQVHKISETKTTVSKIKVLLKQREEETKEVK